MQYKKDRVNAMLDFQQAIKLDDTYSLAYFNAANIYFHCRRFNQVYYIIYVLIYYYLISTYTVEDSIRSII